MKHRDWLVIALIGALVVSLYGVIYPGALASTDHEVLWQSGVRMRAGGADLYGWASGETDAPVYLYPPAYSVLWAGLGVFSQPVATHIWGWLCLFTATTGLLRLSAGLSDTRRAILLNAGLALAGILTAWTFDLRLNGANLLIAGLVAHALVERLRGRFALAALFLALAVQTKVIPIALLPFFVIRGDWKFLAWFAAALLGTHLFVLICTVPALGPAEGLAQVVRLPLDYVNSMVLPHATNMDASVVSSVGGDNISLTDTVRRVISVEMLGHDPKAYREVANTKVFGYLGFLTAFALYALGVLLWWKRSGNAVLVAAAGISFAASILGNVSTFNQHLCGFAVMLLGFVVIIHRRPEIRRSYFMVLGLYYLGVMLPLTAYYTDPSESTFLSRVVDWGGPSIALTAMVLTVFVVAWKYGKESDPANSPPGTE